MPDISEGIGQLSGGEPDSPHKKPHKTRGNNFYRVQAVWSCPAERGCNYRYPLLGGIAFR